MAPTLTWRARRELIDHWGARELGEARRRASSRTWRCGREPKWEWRGPAGGAKLGRPGANRPRAVMI